MNSSWFSPNRRVLSHENSDLQPPLNLTIVRLLRSRKVSWEKAHASRSRRQSSIPAKSQVSRERKKARAKRKRTIEFEVQFPSPPTLTVCGGRHLTMFLIGLRSFRVACIPRNTGGISMLRTDEEEAGCSSGTSLARHLLLFPHTVATSRLTPFSHPVPLPRSRHTRRGRRARKGQGGREHGL